MEDSMSALETGACKHRSLDTIWREKRVEEATRLEQAKAEIERIERRIQEVRKNGGTKLENVRYVSRSICKMPVRAKSWYEITPSWIRNPERAILAAFDRDGYRVSFHEKFDQRAQSFCFTVTISWE